MFSNKTDPPVSAATGGIGKPPETVARPTYDKARAVGPSIIEEGLIMKGDLEAVDDVLVKGKVFGTIKCKVLIIDAGALVEGGVEADEVIIRGNSKGTVKANVVRLEKSASVESDIFHHTFSVEEGARIKGALHFKEDPLSADAQDATSQLQSHPTKPRNGTSVFASPSDSPHSAIND